MWSRVWGYRQQDYRSWPSEIKEHVQVVRIKLNRKVDFIKVEFSNVYGTMPIEFDKIEWAVYDSMLQNRKKSGVCTMHEAEAICIPNGEECESDRIHAELEREDILELNCYLSKPTCLTSGIVSYSRLNQEVLNWSLEGEPLDQRTYFEMVKQNHRMFYIYGISGIQAEVSQPTTIACFGDSLTQQGFWIDAFKNRLCAQHMDISVINLGIGGGRVLQDTNPDADTFQRHGRAGIKRYLSDVFSIPGLEQIIVFYGINDVLGTHMLSKEQQDRLYEELIHAYIFFSEEARVRNKRIYIATLLPMKGSGLFSVEAERMRKRVNAWIRSSGYDYYDDVFYFDEAVADDEDGEYLKRNFECGDGLHIWALGGDAVANSIPLDVLVNKEGRAYV